MAAEQGIAVSIGGGLDKTSSSFDMFKTPGAATRLKNFEASIHGGYRRVNGYRKFMSSPVTALSVTAGGTGYGAASTLTITDSEGNGTGATGTLTIDGSGVITGVTLSAGGSGYQIAPTITISDSGVSGSGATITATITSSVTPAGTSAPLKGVHAHKEGGWACQSGGIYWSENGYDWIQVNKDYGSCSAGGYTTQQSCEEANKIWTASWATAANLALGTVVTLDTSGRYQFTEYIPTGIDSPRITAVNGVDAPIYLETKLVSGVRQFKFHRGLYDAFGLSKASPVYADIPKPQFCVTHDDHVVLGAWSTKPETVYYSDRYDDSVFTGASSGSLNVGDKVTGLKTFRDDLIIFSLHSINKLVNINVSASIAITDVTRNIGCIDGFSIQEIGGDLVFLAPDGIRTVAATARIDDIELSSISHKIIPVINELVIDVDNYDVSSAVIRTQNQYRLFYTKSATSKLSQKGIVGTFKINAQGIPVWEWAELQGIEASCFTSNYNTENVEMAYHGDYNGYVHFHNIGNSFDGDNISAEFKTPDIDYGDVGIRKTLHYIKLSIKPEGDSDINMDVRYDFEDPELSQPATFSLGTLLTPSLFGVAVFGTARFGSPEIPMKKINLWGSGFSNSFKFYSNDKNPPYSIQGMYIDLIPSGRR